MKTFQKIKTLDNELLREEQLRDKGVDVLSFEKGDSIVITEKLDGSNASVKRVGDEIQAFSHHRRLDEDNTLNGFYEFTQNDPVFKDLPEGIIVFGEWLTPHRLKYHNAHYKKFYVFDLFNEHALTYEGYNGAVGLYSDILFFSKNIMPVPVIYFGDGVNLTELNQIAVDQEHQSVMSVNGDMEGIVVSDLDKVVPIDEGTKGPIRIKIVNQAFRETKTPKGTGGNGSGDLKVWLANNITSARVSKAIESMREDGKLTSKVSFDWMKNGNNEQIALKVLLDAIEESETLPPEIKDLLRFSKKATDKFVALSIKGMI